MFEGRFVTVVTTLAFLWLVGALRAQAPAAPESVYWPADSGFTNVKDLGAKGDGQTDDTRAIQEAIKQKGGIYFPPGTYLVSDTLQATPKRHFFQGAGPGKSIIRLKAGSAGFDNPQKPKAVLANWDEQIGRGANGQAFRNSFHDLAVEVGAGNPGAIGILYFNNNQGTIENVLIRALDPKTGFAGLALAQNWPGPALIRHLRVEGFDYGVWSIIGQYSFTFEHCRVEGQRLAGIYNRGQMLFFRNLQSRNRCPAMQLDSGSVVVVESSFAGGAAEAAVTAGKVRLVVRNLNTEGYASAMSVAGQKVAGPKVEEWASGDVLTLADASGKRTLNLPVLEAPYAYVDAPDQWVSVASFGAKPDDKQDDTEGIQKAIDAGKAVVYLPRGTYDVKGTILVRGKVRRIACMESNLETGDGAAPVWRIVDGDSPSVIIERYEGTYSSKRLSFEHASTRALVLRTMVPRGDFYRNTVKGGQLFLDDVCGDQMVFDHQTVYARQANPETLGTKVLNDGGLFWCLGLKTEKAGTILHTKAGGKSEVLGGYFYYNRGNSGQGSGVPILNEDSSVCVTANLNGSAKGVQIREVRQGQTKEADRWPVVYIGR